MDSKIFNINLRLPAKLRDRLASLAQLGSRSMNTEIVQRLEASTGGGARSVLLEAIEMPRAVRVRSPNTKAAVRNFLAACAELDADRVVLAARRDEYNDAVLVALLQAPHLSALMDDCELSLARAARIAEVGELLRGLAQLDLLATTRFVGQHVPDTRAMPADAAAAAVLAGGVASMELAGFLSLLACGREVDPQVLGLHEALPA